jgi:hypothetical protein
MSTSCNSRVWLQDPEVLCAAAMILVDWTLDNVRLGIVLASVQHHYNLDLVLSKCQNFVGTFSTVMEKKVCTLMIDTEILEKLDQLRMLTTATFSNNSFVSYISLKLYLNSMSRNEVKANDHYCSGSYSYFDFNWPSFINIESGG